MERRQHLENETGVSITGDVESRSDWTRLGAAVHRAALVAASIHLARASGCDSGPLKMGTGSERAIPSTTENIDLRGACPLFQRAHSEKRAASEAPWSTTGG